MSLRPFHSFAIATCLGLTALVGCKSDKDHDVRFGTAAPATSGTGGTNSGTGGTNTSTNPGGTPASTLDVAATQANAVSKAVADVVVMAVTLQVTGPDPVELSALNVTASGTTDESVTLGELKLIGDDNANGVLDQGEQALVTVAAPAFPTDNATVTVTLASPIQIAGGASLSLLIAVDATPATQNALTHVGETIVLGITAAADITATVNAQPLPPTANFPLNSGTTTLYVHDHLLISEIVRMGTSGEYVELYNPTAAPIDLTDVYITDATYSTAPYTFYYHNLPTGTGFQPRTAGDFLARFPAGATVAPGQAITIAMDGAGFETTYSQAADYSLRNASGGSVDMLGDDGNNPPAWAVPATGITGGLTNGGEPVIVFRWDGQSDLVQDVDYFYYGTETATNTRIEKEPGISIDGPDADTNPSTYLADTPTFNQAQFVVGSFPSNAIARVEFTETGETPTGGNGELGHDETSEPFDVNFANAAPTPGTP